MHQGKAPHESVTPLQISRDGLFKLDVDDDVWQDIELGDSIGAPPAWLANEKVYLGIKSVLELMHCEEEENHLLRERKALIEWFKEEWRRLRKANMGAGKECHCMLIYIADMYFQIRI